MLVCYPYTPDNRSDVLALARTHFMYLASVDSLHPSINHTDAHTSSLYAEHLTGPELDGTVTSTKHGSNWVERRGVERLRFS